jgi:YD repeat-containing protein
MGEFGFGGEFQRWTTVFFGLSCSKTVRLFTTLFLTVDSRTMKARYFQDTDTLYFELRAAEVTDTRDLDQDTILDYDAEGNVVGITLEHAKSKVGGGKVEFEMIPA